MQESNLRLAALAIEVTPAYGIFRIRVKGRMSVKPLLAELSACWRSLDLNQTTSPFFRGALTEAWLHYGTVHDCDGRSNKRPR